MECLQLVPSFIMRFTITGLFVALVVPMVLQFTVAIESIAYITADTEHVPLLEV